VLESRVFLGSLVALLKIVLLADHLIIPLPDAALTAHDLIGSEPVGLLEAESDQPHQTLYASK
jgi:hypothetical protein